MSQSSATSNSDGLGNRGPITTALPLPTSCHATLTSGYSLAAGHYLDNDFDRSCYPSGLPSSVSWGSYYHSPAVCPRGWTTATTFTSSSVDGGGTSPLGSGTTAAVCCPPEYSYLQWGHVCGSTITSGQSFVYIATGSSSGQVDWGRLNPTTTTATKATSAIGDGIPIWWQAKDLAVLSPTSSLISSTRFSSQTSAQYSSPTATTNISAPAPPGNGGLSTGAKVGIGIGVLIMIVGALVLGFIFGKKRTNRNVTDSAMVQQAMANDPPALERPHYRDDQMHEVRTLQDQYQSQFPARGH